MQVTRLPWSLFFRMFCRSFLLQASWNFERLQNLGFFYLMLPGLRSLYGKSLTAEACVPYGEYFNTHPYLAPLVAGTALRIEQERLAGGETPVDVETYKATVMAPFAAMGDAFFWGGVRPLAALVGLLIALQGSLWAPLVFLGLFNLPHLVFRASGLLFGYFLALRAIEKIQKCRLPDLAIRLKESSTVLLGVLCAYLSYNGCAHQAISAAWGFVVLPVVLLFAWLAHKGVSSLFMVLVTTTSLLLLALVF